MNRRPTAQIKVLRFLKKNESSANRAPRHEGVFELQFSLICENLKMTRDALYEVRKTLKRNDFVTWPSDERAPRGCFRYQITEAGYDFMERHSDIQED